MQELVPLPLGKDWWKEISESTIVSKTQLQLPLSMMRKLAPARVPLQATHKLSFHKLSYCEHLNKT